MLRLRVLVPILAAAALTATGLSAAAAAPPDALDPVVVTDKGAVRGVAHDGFRTFKGIPYAAPPVDRLRWRAPAPAASWTGVRDATEPGSQCAQLAPAYGGESTFDEDCLFLNVFAPNKPGKRKLPVMVWFHGGGNTTGSSTGYDGSKLAVDGDVVVVSVNYRLGAIGWLAHAGLDGAYESGNYGLLDQQAALRWVQRNIAAFGGNRRNVTVFGESAGSIDTCAQIASPAAAGLFHKAIPQSGSCAAGARSDAGAEAEGRRLADAVGCGDAADVAECLRATPAKDLVEAFGAEGLNAGPVVGDPRVLPRTYPDAIDSGHFNRMPVMHGSTLDEMRLYVGLEYPRPITVEQYEQIVRSTYGPAADAVLELYPASAFDEPRHALAAIRTDSAGGLSTCAHQDAFAKLEAAGVPVFAYQFADRGAPPLIDMPGYDEGAEHATELTYLFPGLLGELDEPQQELSDTMVAYWTSFAHHGRPVAPRAPRWPAFRDSGDVLQLAPGKAGILTVDTAAASHCAFWAGVIG
ncbi:carboxylesterase family protein [Nocardioides sp.]|uniref:carboxylesterase/lipase family protein n=1 Tax=Nocardioides sp. TaxID=35761 RepID=UPI0025EE2804|nr:carboxylesterase family protein [Nocardioides sp.]